MEEKLEKTNELLEEIAEALKKLAKACDDYDDCFCIKGRMMD